MKSTCCRQLTRTMRIWDTPLLDTMHSTYPLVSCSLDIAISCNSLLWILRWYICLGSRSSEHTTLHLLITQPLCYDICGTSEVGLDIAINTIQEMTIPMNPSKRDGRRDIGYRRYESISISMQQDVGGYFFLATVRRQGHRAYSRFGFIVRH